jgi:hypothetical protein
MTFSCPLDSPGLSQSDLHMCGCSVGCPDAAGYFHEFDLCFSTQQFNGLSTCRTFHLCLASLPLWVIFLRFCAPGSATPAEYHFSVALCLTLYPNQHLPVDFSSGSISPGNFVSAPRRKSEETAMVWDLIWFGVLQRTFGYRFLGCLWLGIALVDRFSCCTYLDSINAMLYAGRLFCCLSRILISPSHNSFIFVIKPWRSAGMETDGMWTWA